VTAVVGLTIASPVEPWTSIGLRVDGASAWIGGVELRFVDAAAPPDSSLIGWTLAGSPSADADIDGLSTAYDDETEPQSWTHPMGATSIDHVVVMTSSIERTCGAIEASTGEPLKRIREAGPIRQGFHRLGPVIAEVVESSRVTASTSSFWGFVLVVDDLHDVAGRLGPDVISMPKAAVQPGRFIASFRESVGLGLPLALMSA